MRGFLYVLNNKNTECCQVQKNGPVFGLSFMFPVN